MAYTLRAPKPVALLPLIVVPVLLVLSDRLGLPGFPVFFLVAFGLLVLYQAWQRSLVLKVDAGGVHLGRGVRYEHGDQRTMITAVPWSSIRDVVVVSPGPIGGEGGTEVGVRLKPGAPLPDGARSMIVDPANPDAMQADLCTGVPGGSTAGVSRRPWRPTGRAPRWSTSHAADKRGLNIRDRGADPTYHQGVDTANRPVRILVVEDDDEIAQVLQRSLRMEGYEVKLAGDGVQGLEEAHAFLPDLIVLDLGLPRLDGVDVAKRLREDGDAVPILMLTARDALESRVEGLDVGADDYLVKPFERQELLARMRALLRRKPPRGMAPLRVGDLMLNPDTHEVSRGERKIDLTQREFELLEYLMRNERLVISRQKLLDEVWGYDPFSITNTIEVFVSNLRRKLEADGEPRLLHTVRGAGYVLRV